MSFDQKLNEYEKWRPKYSKEVFSAICNYSHIDKSKILVEVGCGTGQATEFFLECGSRVIAIESGKNFAKFVADKFAKYANFKVYNLDFENFTLQNNSIDLIYAATSFHWVNEEVGFRKVFNMLKRGGTIALFWNTPFVNRIDDPLHQDIQKIYKKYRPNEPTPIENNTEKYRLRRKTIEKYGFVNLKLLFFHQTRTFSSKEYISLLNTYSDHITLPPKIKNAFEKEIIQTIDKHGGILKVYDTIDLYLAKKP